MNSVPLGKVTCRNRNFTSTIKLRVTDFLRILLLAKDEETEPLIDAILSEPANGLTWLTLREVMNLNWVDSLKRYHLYVENGGGFLMFGGWEICQGHDVQRCGLYKGTPIEEIVPVEFSSEFLRKEPSNCSS